MSLFGKLFGYDKPAKVEQAVLVHFEYASTDLSRLFALEEVLERVLAREAVGELDGNEIGADGNDATLFLYGPDADALFARIRPTLESTDFTRGARVVLRYGPPGAGTRAREVVIRP